MVCILHDYIERGGLVETLEQRVLRHEGIRLKMYLDTEGVPTIGVGHNLRDKPIRKEAAMLIFRHDLEDAANDVVEALPWSVDLPPAKQEILIECAFQLGIGGLLKFKKMLTALKAGDYNQASYEMLHSKWAEQTPSRASELAELMRS